MQYNKQAQHDPGVACERAVDQANAATSKDIAAPSQGAAAQDVGVAANETASGAYEFRYHKDLRELPDCPPAATTSPLAAGYRFAQSDLKHPNNSLPPIKINPDPFALAKPKRCCSGFGLSMYATLSALRDRASKGVRHSPLFLKRLGDHYVKVHLTAASGRQTIADSNGHFDLFEYASFDFHTSVAEHLKL